MTDRQLIIPTRPGMGRGLINHDEESKNFRATKLLTPQQDAPKDRTWRRIGALDQGDTPECVAYTGVGMMNTLPLSRLWPYAKRIKFSEDDWYNGARKNDEWRGENYQGTSGLGLCRYLKKIGIIKEYHWCFGLTDVLMTLSWVGPVGIGINWTNDMFNPDANGFIHPTGGDAGGHQIELTAINVHEGSVTVTNSWGKTWGDEGKAKMSWDDLGNRLDNQGDAFTITA